MSHSELFLGIDIGTTGIRAIAIDAAGAVHGESTTVLPAPQRNRLAIEQEPQLWWHGIETVLDALVALVEPERIQAICVDGTSGTVLLADESSNPIGPALMYNDARASAEATHIARHAARNTAAHGASSGLAKLMWLLAHCAERPAHVHTQADWIATRLGATAGVCDSNNALKLGYDPIERRWPYWLETFDLPAGILPQVVPAGVPIGTLTLPLAQRWGFRPDTLVISGTTDSTAAFIASGATQAGEAVTALGSTLVLKVVSHQPVFAPEYGIYSQPLGEMWLVGGASNSGGAVLRQFFSDEEMEQLTTQLRPQRSLCFDYYPLPAIGERFPYNDPQMMPRVSPRPRDNGRFFQALLEGITGIERTGYLKLAALGAPYPTSIRSNGGGARNAAWTQMRGRILRTEMIASAHTEAAYGAALLARSGASTV